MCYVQQALIRLRQEKMGYELHEVELKEPMICTQEGNVRYRPTPKDFRVTSFNVLADCLADESQFPWATEFTL